MNKFIIVLVGFIFMSFTGLFQSKSPVVGFAIGNKVPEINLPDTSGKNIALSSLKGKIVLIDFWASWCRPCRMENPNLIAAYKKFNKAKFKKAKGFEIYSASLDNSKPAWLAAIQKDALSWPHNVIDHKGETAKAYSVYSIPTNYLIGPNGIILAKNLRGPALEAELQKYLK